MTGPERHVVPPGPAIVVLAAGQSSRFLGGHKLMAPFAGSSVLCTTLGNALASDLPVVVVTTASLADTVRRCVAVRNLVLVNAEVDGTTFGMGHSIAAGVAASARAGGWLILPADMPLVQPGTLRSVARALATHAVAYAQYRGQRGHPVGFGAALGPELEALQGDTGARRLVAAYPAHGVQTADAGVLIDIDTNDDLAHASSLYEEPLTAAAAKINPGPAV